MIRDPVYDGEVPLESAEDWSALAVQGVLFGETGLTLPESMEFEDWQALGVSLGRIARAALWWWGDWFVFGERHYGESYAQALNATDYAYQTLRDATWVCGKIEMSRRRDNLSFSHHKEVAALEPDEQDRYLAQAEVEGWTQKELRRVVRRGALAQPTPLPAGSLVPDLRTGDFRDVLNDLSDVDAIITDPPYPQEFLPLFTDLADVASRILKPGGWCAVMVGQTYLPEVIARLGSSLLYHWSMAYLTPGGQAVQIWPRQVNTFWKPVLLFTNGTREDDESWIGDVTRSDVNDNDKRFHEWGQSESGMAQVVERLTQPGELVCDPFLGAGTTGVVALTIGRRFVGCDLDPAHVETAASRMVAS